MSARETPETIPHSPSSLFSSDTPPAQGGDSITLPAPATGLTNGSATARQLLSTYRCFVAPADPNDPSSRQRQLRVMKTLQLVQSPIVLSLRQAQMIFVESDDISFEKICPDPDGDGVSIFLVPLSSAPVAGDPQRWNTDTIIRWAASRHQSRPRILDYRWAREVLYYQADFWDKTYDVNLRPIIERTPARLAPVPSANNGAPPLSDEYYEEDAIDSDDLEGIRETRGKRPSNSQSSSNKQRRVSQSSRSSTGTARDRVNSDSESALAAPTPMVPSQSLSARRPPYRSIFLAYELDQVRWMNLRGLRALFDYDNFSATRQRLIDDFAASNANPERVREQRARREAPPVTAPSDRAPADPGRHDVHTETRTTRDPGSTIVIPGSLTGHTVESLTAAIAPSLARVLAKSVLRGVQTALDDMVNAIDPPVAADLTPVISTRHRPQSPTQPAEQPAVARDTEGSSDPPQTICEYGVSPSDVSVFVRH